jgi:hypothetical protein
LLRLIIPISSHLRPSRPSAVKKIFLFLSKINIHQSSIVNPPSSSQHFPYKEFEPRISRIFTDKNEWQMLFHPCPSVKSVVKILLFHLSPITDH